MSPHRGTTPVPESTNSSDRVTSPDTRALTAAGDWDHRWNRASRRRDAAAGMRRLVSFDTGLAALLTESVAAARPGDGRSTRVLEIGCGNSLWLPFLAQDPSIEAHGVDYSLIGCTLVEDNLAAVGATGTIVCENLFEFARAFRGAFDVVTSFGVIEHFTDIASVLAAIRTLLRPGGVLFASVPNLAGIYGPMQRLIDETVLRQHVVVTPAALAEHAACAGLVGIETGYVGGPLRLSLLNFAHVRWLGAMPARAVSRGLFEIDRMAARLSPARWRRHARTAAYVYLRGTSGSRV